MHLAARPQVNLRSMGRRRFAHLSDQGDEIHVDANIPWGSTTLFTLEFRDDSRLYAIHTANNRYLSRDGRLLEQCNATCLFSLEYHAGALALRDTQGLYLAPLGSKVCCSLSLSAFIVIDFCIPRISLPFSLPPPSFYEIGRLGGTKADCCSSCHGFGPSKKVDRFSRSKREEGVIRHWVSGLWGCFCS